MFQTINDIILNDIRNFYHANRSRKWRRSRWHFKLSFEFITLNEIIMMFCETSFSNTEIFIEYRSEYIHHDKYFECLHSDTQIYHM